MVVKDEKLLESWKDFATDLPYSNYKAMMDKQHLDKAKSMPVRF